MPFKLKAYAERCQGMSLAPSVQMHANDPEINSLSVPELYPRLSEQLARPLIVGASVSANHRGIASPARELALRATTPKLIRTLAKNGQAASDFLNQIQQSDVEDRTSVIGIDLFFWDSTRHTPEVSIRLFRNFAEKVAKLDLPFAVGEVPGFFPPLQPSLAQLNQELHRFKKEYAKCILFPFDQIYHEILKTGELHHHGAKYTISDLIPDGLHLSALAGRVLADRLQDEWMAQILLPLDSK